MLMKKIMIFGILLQVIPGWSKKCSSDTECPSIQSCQSGRCQEDYHPEPCGQREDCLRSQYGYECVQGRCGCSSTNKDCPAGNFCTKKRCLLTGKYCNTNKECSQSNKGHRCEEGQCVCFSDMDCNAYYNCVEKRCLMDMTKMKDPMKDQMERMGHPSYHEEGMGLGHEEKYGAHGHGHPMEGMHHHQEL